jgi:hypothetical protein
VPATALPEGVSCTFIVRGSIPDSDLIDLPDTIGADVIITFTTDAAPDYVSSIPVANGDVVGTGQAISFTFDENVADLGGCDHAETAVAPSPGRSAAAARRP